MRQQLRPRPTSASDPYSVYLREIDQSALLSAAEEAHLAKETLAGCTEARDRMVRGNLRLVVSIARKYVRRGMDIQDLVEEGNLGLLRAVESFDPGMNTRFSTYATFWIRQSIKRGVLNSLKTVRIPAYMATLMAKWQRATNKLSDDFGRPPTREEVAGYLGLSAKKVRVIQKAIQIHNSGPYRDTTEDAWDISEIPLEVPPSRPSGEEVAQVLALLDKMDKREAAILRMRFGLHDGPPMTLKQVGENLGLTRERVRQIARGALSKLADRLQA